MKICKNCFENNIDESKQNFDYRDGNGDHWYAGSRPLCDECINDGTQVDDGSYIKLLLGSKRTYRYQEDGYGNRE